MNTPKALVWCSRLVQLNEPSIFLPEIKNLRLQSRFNALFLSSNQDHLFGQPNSKNCLKYYPLSKPIKSWRDCLDLLSLGFVATTQAKQSAAVNNSAYYNLLVLKAARTRRIGQLRWSSTSFYLLLLWLDFKKVNQVR